MPDLVILRPAKPQPRSNSSDATPAPQQSDISIVVQSFRPDGAHDKDLRLSVAIRDRSPTWEMVLRLSSYVAAGTVRAVFTTARTFESAGLIRRAISNRQSAPTGHGVPGAVVGGAVVGGAVVGGAVVGGAVVGGAVVGGAVVGGAVVGGAVVGERPTVVGVPDEPPIGGVTAVVVPGEPVLGVVGAGCGAPLVEPPVFGEPLPSSIAESSRNCDRMHSASPAGASPSATAVRLVSTDSPTSLG